MELIDAVKLIRPAFVTVKRSSVWADFGCGNGLFTRALASLLPAGSTVHAVDRQAQDFEDSLNGCAIAFHQRDFAEERLAVGSLDGILMANSLHFVGDKRGLIQELSRELKPGGCLLIIEYEMSQGNPWVPFPITWESLASMLHKLDFDSVTLVGKRKSSFEGRTMYACCACFTIQGDPQTS